MQKILEELKNTPGILGSSVYTSQQGIIATNMPEIFKPDTQKRIGIILHRIFKLNDSVNLDVTSYEIQYDEALLLVKKLCKSSSLILICEPDAKVNLLNMSVNMLTTDLMDAIEGCEQPQEQLAISPPPADPKTVINGSLSGELTMMKRALAKSIGPIAGKILEKSIKTWLEQGNASGVRLKELAEIMSQEIDHGASRRTFFADIKEII